MRNGSRHKGARALAVGAVMLSLVAAACGSSSKKTTGSTSNTTGGASATPTTNNPNPIKIGIEEPLSGPTASKDSADMVQNVLQKMKEFSVIDGRPVQIIVRDDQGSATTAAAVARQLIDQDKVDVFLGPQFTPLAQPVLPLVTAAKLFE